MIDYFSIALTHGLILLACWRLLFRADLDEEGGAAAQAEKPWLRDRNRDQDQEHAADA
ncbi:hypothetical protein [Aurantiacibacter rhizosphaerae]|uniref:Uncharacterized protein n=1 Tax=Aurantiacibacter rhizosphaerae TaxID=2691582 RepID=A0A844X840_9SPHN|nr:hypothetical protein [Aurantiacibacter rhizosphaerae]MWV26541.1 hypothetical protein [Aurantiacibacter rhizosphaerae]